MSPAAFFQPIFALQEPGHGGGRRLVRAGRLPAASSGDRSGPGAKLAMTRREVRHDPVGRARERFAFTAREE